MRSHRPFVAIVVCTNRGHGYSFQDVDMVPKDTQTIMMRRHVGMIWREEIILLGMKKLTC